MTGGIRDFKPLAPITPLTYMEFTKVKKPNTIKPENLIFFSVSNSFQLGSTMTDTAIGNRATNQFK
ncbi:hypothetical protein MnBA_01630 [Marinobacterium sp. BA1]